MKIADVMAELARHPEGTFLDLLAFNNHNFGACSITGVSPVWEMHPDTDEFFHILQGRFEVTLLEGEQPVHQVVEPGCSFVVPRGVWHKPAAPSGAKFLYFTPGTSLHSDADDPRQPR